MSGSLQPYSSFLLLLAASLFLLLDSRVTPQDNDEVQVHLDFIHVCHVWKSWNNLHYFITRFSVCMPPFIQESHFTAFELVTHQTHQVFLLTTLIMMFSGVSGCSSPTAPHPRSFGARWWTRRTLCIWIH